MVDGDAGPEELRRGFARARRPHAGPAMPSHTTRARSSAEAAGVSDPCNVSSTLGRHRTAASVIRCETYEVLDGADAPSW
jgi:hypothetical protein